MTPILKQSEVQPSELQKKLIQQKELDQKGPKITFYFQSTVLNKYLSTKIFLAIKPNKWGLTKPTRFDS
jgi:hypothetical protein